MVDRLLVNIGRLRENSRQMHSPVGSTQLEGNTSANEHTYANGEVPIYIPTYLPTYRPMKGNLHLDVREGMSVSGSTVPDFQGNGSTLPV